MPVLTKSILLMLFRRTGKRKVHYKWSQINRQINAFFNFSVHIHVYEAKVKAFTYLYYSYTITLKIKSTHPS